MKGVGIDDAFVEDHSVSLGFFGRFQGFGVGVTFDIEGIVYGDDSGFIEGYSDFVDDVGFEKVKVQMTLSSRAEGESAYFFPPLFPLWFGARNSWGRQKKTQRCGPRVSIP